ncbi:MAG: murein biosynthesis integral membrane protein MurJ [Leptospira sp.]|nr:murein biosynthesis integral membrane protein MurJ [Leptospira sp.]
MSKPEESSASKSIALSFYTFLSRVLGLFRDHYMAVSFGTGWIASAFSVAYRLPNMFRNLLAEGTLSQSFMPLYSESGKFSEEEAQIMAGSVLSFLFFLLTLFVALFLLFAPFLLPYLVGGTKDYSDLVIELSFILFFLIMTASLSSIFMAISNSKNRFFIPSLSPIVLNLSYLFIFIFVFRFVEGGLERVKVLSVGIVCGGILQLLIQVVYVKKLGSMPRINFNWRHPAIAKIFKLMLPAVIGGGFYQISLLVDIFLANYIQNHNPGLGAVVSLDYSQRLVQFPTGIIGVALATTTLPAVLNSVRKNETALVPAQLTEVLGFCLYLTLPSALGLAILGKSIIDSIYFGGKWDFSSTETTILPLLFYSLAVPFFSINKVLTSSYYAFQDTKTPLKVNLISFSLSILLSLILMNFLKHAGLAVSSGLASLLTTTLLIMHFPRHGIRIEFRIIIVKIFRMAFPLLLLSAWLVLIQFYLYKSLLDYFYSFGLSHANASRAILSVGMIPAMLLYFGTSYLLGLDDLKIVLNKFRRK